MPTCGYPDIGLGVALRLSRYLDCQARALGEQGFQALIGGPIVTGLLSACVTIFVALIGYRLILGDVPDLRDGVGRTVRLGIVLALVTGWPACQVLFYRVAVDGPVEVASTLLPAAELPSDRLDERVQQAYDTMRLGGGAGGAAPTEINTVPGAAASPVPAPAASLAGIGPYAQPALPQTAAAFAASTIGIGAALKVTVGLLLALAPLALLGLLFDATLGLFSGWLRALAGSALGVTFATLVTALDLVVVEGELGAWQSLERGASIVDAEALTTAVLCFVPVMLASVWAATRFAGAFRLEPRRPAFTEVHAGAAKVLHGAPDLPTSLPASARAATATTLPGNATRARGVADALAATVHREVRGTVDRGQDGGHVVGLGSDAAGSVDGTRSLPRHRTALRRTSGRRTRSAAARDRT